MTETQKAIKGKFDNWKKSDYLEFIDTAAISIFGGFSGLTLFTTEDKDHITNMLKAMVHVASGQAPGGDFIKCLVRKDFYEAIKQADSINIKAIQIYASFIYNELPFDCEETLKEKET